MTIKVRTETGLWGEIREYFIFTSALEARRAMGDDFVDSHTVLYVSCREYRVYK